MPLPSTRILLVGRLVPLGRPMGRRLAKISTNQPNTPRRSSCCDCPPRQRPVPGHRGAAEAPGVGRVVASVLPSVGLVAGAVLAKETALSLPALLVAWDFCAAARLPFAALSAIGPEQGTFESFSSQYKNCGSHEERIPSANRVCFAGCFQ